MPIKFHPRVGEVLNCDYRGLIYPEMDKRRLAVVISPDDFARDYLCTVVPLSTTPPPKIEKYHHILEKDPYPESDEKVWVKADMLMTVSFARLSGYHDGKVEGKRQYVKLHVSAHDLACIKKCVLHALGLGGLTQHIS